MQITYSIKSCTSPYVKLLVRHGSTFARELDNRESVISDEIHTLQYTLKS